MIIQRKINVVLVLMTGSVFLFQGCITPMRIIRGTDQKIPVTSHPPGAKIILDGEDVGYTPLSLRLVRKKSHIILIEKSGYNPFSIIINQKKKPGYLVLSILGNCFFGWAIYTLFGEATDQGTGYYEQGVFSWFYAPVLISIITDNTSGALSTLSPEQIEVKLSKIDDKSKPNFILIDERQLQNIKWIRIR
jgi:hypothetical protein